MPRSPLIGDHITQVLVKNIDGLVIRNRVSFSESWENKESGIELESPDNKVHTKHISRFY